MGSWRNPVLPGNRGPSDAPVPILCGARHDPVGNKTENHCGHNAAQPNTSLTSNGMSSSPTQQATLLRKLLMLSTRWKGISQARSVRQRLCQCTLLKALEKSAKFT